LSYKKADVAELIQAHDAGKDINLNGLKQRYSRKHKAQNQPKLVDIIAAIPEQYKAVLLPNLKAKPVRTASGVCFKRGHCHSLPVCRSIMLDSKLTLLT
jgi:histone acetyltransferase (RNA polymerase elongator complex component)